jgi:methyl-accepting chemotaxis protein
VLVKVLKNLSVAQKLYGSFGFVLVLLLVVLAVSLKGMGGLGAETGHITKEAQPKLVAALELKYDGADLNGWQTGYVLDRGKSRADFEHSSETFEKNLARLEKLSTDSIDKAGFASIKASYDKFMDLDAPTWAAIQAGDTAKAEAIALGPEIAAYNTLSAGLDAYVSDATKDVTTAEASFAATKSSSTTLMLAVGAIALLLSAALAFLIARGIKSGITKVLGGLTSLDREDFAALGAGLGAVSQGDLTVPATAVTKPVDDLGGDEVGLLGRTFNSMLEKAPGGIASYNEMREQLEAIVGKISQAAVQLSSASEQMASTSEEAGRAVGEIANAVSDVATGAERQVRMVEDAKTSTDATAQVAVETKTAAEHGVDAARRAAEAMVSVRESSGAVSDAMSGLAAKSEQIGGIVETITGIAGQTNLLALNAAIEAARAGEQGKGFAVVAEEVRKLAEESQAAAASIATLVDEIQSETNRTAEVVEDGARRSADGVDVVEEAREAFLRIGSSVEDVTGRIGSIAAAMSEVAAVAEQSSASSEQVSASTEETSASTQEIAASAQELARTAEELAGLVGQFKVAA